MKICRLALLSIISLFISASALAQNKFTESANEAFEANEFYVATELYKKAYSKEKSRQTKAWINFRIGESYKNMGDPRQAANYFKRAVRMRYEDPIATLYLADMYKRQGEYEDAIEEYSNYKQAVPSDPRGEEGIDQCKMAKEWMNQPSRYTVDNFSVINSRNNDFSPAFGKRDFTELYFTSSREESNGRETDGWTGESFTDVFVTSVDRKRRGRRGREGPVTWTSPVPVAEVINSPYNEGAVTFNKRYNMMYFTRCDKVKKKTMGCSIYMARKRGSGFADPEVLNIPQDSGTTIGHPAMSPDDKVLYFAANLEGGFGGNDLYMSTYDRRERSWSAPQNLGPTINTEGDEMFPFVHENGMLYFASNGLPGMGGLDIFSATIGENGSFGDPVNLQFPINSSADDFGLVWAEDEVANGFLTSNRKGGRGGDDIYQVTLLPLRFTLEGVVTDAKTGQSVPNVDVKLVGDDGTTVTVKSDDKGEYFFEQKQLNEDVTYTISFGRDEYLTKSGQVSTVAVPLEAFERVDDGFLHRLVHNKEIDPIRKPIVLPKIEYDLASAELRLEAKDALDGLVEVLEDNPEVIIELRSHTDFRGTDAQNLKLSRARAQSCVDYLISKGIDSTRLIPIGMGEKEPFVLEKDESGFKEGTKFDEGFIRGLSSTEEQEIAHQFNRRTDFKVLERKFTPKSSAPEEKPEEETPEDEGNEENNTEDEGEE